jgi:hypothetical protein
MQPAPAAHRLRHKFGALKNGIRSSRSCSDSATTHSTRSSLDDLIHQEPVDFPISQANALAAVIAGIRERSIAAFPMPLFRRKYERKTKAARSAAHADRLNKDCQREPPLLNQALIHDRHDF